MSHAQRDPADRVATYCDGCGQTDPDPKHHVFDPNDQRFESHHHDCGAADGCAVCVASEGLTGGKRGGDLAAHVATGKHGDALAKAVGAATPNVEG